MLQENILFANRYQLIKLLGRGGFSEVWLAKDNYTHLEIAIKVYAPGQGIYRTAYCAHSAKSKGRRYSPYPWNTAPVGQRYYRNYQGEYPHENCLQGDERS